MELAIIVDHRTWMSISNKSSAQIKGWGFALNTPPVNKGIKYGTTQSVHSVMTWYSATYAYRVIIQNVCTLSIFQIISKNYEILHTNQGMNNDVIYAILV